MRPDGGLRVWEINTNPQLCSLAMAAATARGALIDDWAAYLSRRLREVDAGLPPASALTPIGRRMRWRLLRARVSRYGHPLTVTPWVVARTLRRALRRR